MKNKEKEPRVRVQEKNKPFNYVEDVNEFTGLIFHCPNCDEHFHLHIATVSIERIEEKKRK